LREREKREIKSRGKIAGIEYRIQIIYKRKEKIDI
jgi:hypothetical protein